MADALSRPARPRLWRLQFSLAGIFVLMTLSAVGVWFWYQRPYEIENNQYATRPDPFAAPGTPTSPALMGREVESVRRVWGGKTVRHGPRRLYDGKDNLKILEHYRNGQLDGEVIEYGLVDSKIGLTTFSRGKKHGPSRRWNSKGELIAEENFSRGLRHGRFDIRRGEFRTSGDIAQAIEGTYDKGQPSGKWIWFPAGGMIIGQWRDGLPDGRWEWRDDDGQVYLSADFDRGRVTSESSADFDAHLPRLFGKAAGEEPRLLLRLFASIDLDFTEAPLKDVVLRVQSQANFPILMNIRALEMAGIGPDLPITYQAKSAPALLALSSALKPHGLTCDYRLGTLWVDTPESIANWKDTTGVSELRPPSGSHLAEELNGNTMIEVVEMPLRDVMLYLGEQHNIPIVLSTKKLEEASISPDTPVTTTLRGLKLQHALAIILDNLDCKATLQGETIFIEPQ